MSVEIDEIDQDFDELSGYGDEFEETLAGVGIDRKTARKLKAIINADRNPSLFRGQFLDRIPSLPKDVIVDIADGKMQVVETMLYNTVSVQSVGSIDVFKKNDDIAIGFCNVEKAMIPKDEHMVVSAIILDYHGGAAAITEENPAAFTKKAYPLEVLNGEFKLRYGRQDVLDAMQVGYFFAKGLQPMASTVPALASGAQAEYEINPAFGYRNGTSPYGVFILDNPKVFTGGQHFEFAIDFAGNLPNDPAHHAFRVGLLGTTVRPYIKK